MSNTAPSNTSPSNAAPSNAAASELEKNQKQWKAMVDTSKIDWSRFDEELNRHYPITPQQTEQYKTQGFIKLKQVFSADLLKAFGNELTNQVIRLNTEDRPLEERTTYGKAFLQITNLWTKNEIVKRFAFSKRVARIAADLMGVRGVRMYHDQALYKEPGGGITPWHADQFYWPLDTNNTITAWIPFQATPLELGPLAFSATSHSVHLGRDLEISDDSEKKISKQLLDHGLPLVETGFDIGEISFHGGWTFHRAAPNNSDRPRKVITIIYVEDGCRIAQPKNKNQQADLEAWTPGRKPGDLVDTALNPVLWPA